MNTILKLLLTALAVFILAYFLSGIHLTGDVYLNAFIVAVVLAVLNVLVKPILVLLTLPITVVTLGLFLLIINALIVMLADKFIDGFTVDSIWWAILFSVLLSFLQSILHSFLNDGKKAL